MNLLKQRVAERLASEPVEETCVRIGAQTPGLVVALSPDKCWVLAWSYLLSADCTTQAGKAKLVLSFTTQVVTAEGQDLAQLLDAVAGFRLGLLRELPSEFRSRVSANAPFVSRIEVRPVQATPPAPQTS
jgi:hypothetical protein